MNETKQIQISCQSKIQKFLNDPIWESRTAEFFCTGETITEFVGYMGMTDGEHKKLLETSNQYKRLVALGESYSRAWWSRAGRMCISSKKASYKAWETSNPYRDRDKQGEDIDLSIDVPKSIKVEFVKSTIDKEIT